MGAGCSMPTTTTPGLWPTVDETADPLALLSRQHQALRGVLEWMPLTIDEEGRGSPADGRLLKAVLHGPLAWHHADEAEVLLPRLSGLGRALDEMSHTCRRHQLGVDSAAGELSGLVADLCRGLDLDPLAWRSSCEALRCALEPAMSFEDESLMPTARMLLEADDLRDMAAELRARAEERPLLAELSAGPASVRCVSTVTILRATGMPPLVRRYADCPRRRTVAIDECALCPHGILCSDDAVACDIDPSHGPARVGDLMTRAVRCVTPEVSLSQVVGLLEEAGVTGAPVVDELGRALGVISQSDVVRVLAQGQKLESTRVSDAMMHAPFCVEENAPIDNAAALLAWEGVHRLPVINARHEVVGIVSALDLVRWRSARDTRAEGPAARAH